MSELNQPSDNRPLTPTETGRLVGNGGNGQPQPNWKPSEKSEYEKACDAAKNRGFY